MDEEPTGAAGDAPAAESEAIFSVLGDETRLRILLELANRSDIEDATKTVSFSEIRRAVGVEDAGRFNYHLDKLQDTFVVKEPGEDGGDGGYRPTVAGLEVASSIHAGRYGGDGVEGAAETDHECPTCGRAISVRYEDDLVVMECPEEHVWFSFPVPPGASVGRSIEELLDVALRRAMGNIELARNGVCPRCWGTTTATLSPAEGTYAELGGEWRRVDVECERCWLAYHVPAPFAVSHSPPVIAFYQRHDLAPRTAVMSDRTVLESSETTLRSEDPLRLEIVVELDGDELRLLLDDGAAVIESEVR
jgi:DNA-binding transcriptional ArsR family regulator